MAAGLRRFAVTALDRDPAKAVYCYEVAIIHSHDDKSTAPTSSKSNGKGKAKRSDCRLMDDANVPSLLSLPYLFSGHTN